VLVVQNVVLRLYWVQHFFRTIVGLKAWFLNASRTFVVKFVVNWIAKLKASLQRKECRVCE
jgi:hypothetical protein